MNDSDLRELGQRLPSQRRDAERVEALRSSLLVAAVQERGRAPRRRWLAVGGAIAAAAAVAAAVGLYVGAERSEQAAVPALVHAAPEAAEAPELRVRDGVVRATTERIRTGDAEVEGAGKYEVSVEGDRLVRVIVAEGTARITVRSAGKQQQIFLAAGETWRAPVDVEVIATPAEEHFQTGWALLRAGKVGEAAVELARAADAGGPLAGDARYFEAVARLRAGDPAAERTLAQFLAADPGSARRGRASLMLGKLLRDRGELAAARARFEAALPDPDPAVAEAARAHLAQLRE